MVNNGLIRTDNYGQWNSNLNLTVNGSGKFEMWNGSVSLATLNGNGTVQNTKYYGRTQTLTVAAGSFSGTITDSGVTSGGSGTGDTRINLVKTGSGTLVLSGANSYTGTTEINAGTLVLSNTGSIGASSAIRLSGSTAVLDVTAAGFTVGSGKTISGIGTVTGNLTVAAGGTLSPGNSVGTFNVGSLTLAASSTLYVEIQWNGNDLVSANGTVTLTDSSLVIPALNFVPVSGASYTILTNLPANAIIGEFSTGDTIAVLNGFSELTSFRIDYLANSVVLTVIPEPSTWALVALALVPLFLRRRSRR